MHRGNGDVARLRGLEVLLVEDNPADARLVSELLRETSAVTLTQVRQLREGMALLREGNFNAVLLDLSLPDSQGLESVARFHAAAPRLPIVVLTGLEDEAAALQAVQAGAQDYLVKGQGDGDLVLRAIRYAMERKRIEDRLLQTLEDLKAAQDRLVQAETHRAVGELAAGVAHHVNNLLTVVVGQIQLLLLQERVPDPDVRRSLETMERASMAGADVIRRLQEYTQVRSLSTTVPVDLNHLAREVFEHTRAFWQAQAQSGQGPVHIALEPGRIPTVEADPAVLREALVNLIRNAVEAMPHGGEITVTTRTSEQTVCCAVTDTGMGMPEEVRRRAMEPFFTTKGPKRTGLGLSLTYGSVRRHGGDLTIETAEGRGTTVTLRLPASLAVPSPPELAFAGDMPHRRVI